MYAHKITSVKTMRYFFMSKSSDKGATYENSQQLHTIYAIVNWVVYS